MKINRKQLRRMIREALVIKEGESERMAARSANRTRMIDGSGRASRYARYAPSSTSATLAKAHVVATVALVAVQTGIAFKEGIFAYKAGSEANELANKNMARSVINRSWLNSLERRKSLGEKTDQGLLKQHINVMRDFRGKRDFDLKKFAEAIAYIAKEDWEGMESDPGGYGDMGDAQDVLSSMIGSARERALPAKDLVL